MPRLTLFVLSLLLVIQLRPTSNEGSETHPHFS